MWPTKAPSRSCRSGLMLRLSLPPPCRRGPRTVALPSDYLAALIDVRVAELRELAAWTAVEYWRTRPTLAERYFPNLLRVPALRRPGED